MPLLRYAKIGERILVCVDDDNTMIPHKMSYTKLLPATVLDKSLTSNGVILGWKAGETPTEALELMKVPVPDFWAKLGFVVAHEYGNHCEYVQCEQAKPAISEKPCRHCSKKNDVGVKSCWWCECPNPTS